MIFFCRSDEDIYIDAYNRRTFKRSRAISIYPTLREQSTSVDSVLIHTMRLLCQNMFGFSAMEVRLYNSRMLCSLIPQDLSVILQYATNCIVQGFHLEDAIQLLQVCRPLKIKRNHFAIFYINICITVFSLQNLNGILKQMTWRSAASVS